MIHREQRGEWDGIGSHAGNVLDAFVAVQLCEWMSFNPILLLSCTHFLSFPSFHSVNSIEGRLCSLLPLRKSEPFMVTCDLKLRTEHKRKRIQTQFVRKEVTDVTWSLSSSLFHPHPVSLSLFSSHFDLHKLQLLTIVQSFNSTTMRHVVLIHNFISLLTQVPIHIYTLHPLHLFIVTLIFLSICSDSHFHSTSFPVPTLTHTRFPSICTSNCSVVNSLGEKRIYFWSR